MISPSPFRSPHTSQMRPLAVSWISHGAVGPQSSPSSHTGSVQRMAVTSPASSAQISQTEPSSLVKVSIHDGSKVPLLTMMASTEMVWFQTP